MLVTAIWIAVVLTLRTDPLGINCGFKKATFFESSLKDKKPYLEPKKANLYDMKILSVEISIFVSFRIYVNSILGMIEVQNLPF